MGTFMPLAIKLNSNIYFITIEIVEKSPRKVYESLFSRI
jgi:hypothetical protein